MKKLLFFSIFFFVLNLSCSVKKTLKSVEKFDYCLPVIKTVQKYNSREWLAYLSDKNYYYIWDTIDGYYSMIRTGTEYYADSVKKLIIKKLNTKESMRRAGYRIVEFPEKYYTKEQMFTQDSLRANLSIKKILYDAYFKYQLDSAIKVGYKLNLRNFECDTILIKKRKAYIELLDVSKCGIDYKSF